jgi:hypothetical protein
MLHVSSFKDDKFIRRRLWHRVFEGRKLEWRTMREITAFPLQSKDKKAWLP